MTIKREPPGRFLLCCLVTFWVTTYAVHGIAIPPHTRRGSALTNHVDFELVNNLNLGSPVLQACPLSGDYVVMAHPQRTVQVVNLATGATTSLPNTGETTACASGEFVPPGETQPRESFVTGPSTATCQVYSTRPGDLPPEMTLEWNCGQNVRAVAMHHLPAEGYTLFVTADWNTNTIRWWRQDDGTNTVVEIGSYDDVTLPHRVTIVDRDNGQTLDIYAADMDPDTGSVVHLSIDLQMNLALVFNHHYDLPGARSVEVASTSGNGQLLVGNDNAPTVTALDLDLAFLSTSTVDGKADTWGLTYCGGGDNLAAVHGNPDARALVMSVDPADGSLTLRAELSAPISAGIAATTDGNNLCQFTFSAVNTGQSSPVYQQVIPPVTESNTPLPPRTASPSAPPQTEPHSASPSAPAQTLPPTEPPTASAPQTATQSKSQSPTPSDSPTKSQSQSQSEPLPIGEAFTLFFNTSEEPFPGAVLNISLSTRDGDYGWQLAPWGAVDYPLFVNISATFDVVYAEEPLIDADGKQWPMVYDPPRIPRLDEDAFVTATVHPPVDDSSSDAPSEDGSSSTSLPVLLVHGIAGVIGVFLMLVCLAISDWIDPFWWCTPLLTLLGVKAEHLPEQDDYAMRRLTWWFGSWNFLGGVAITFAGLHVAWKYQIAGTYAADDNLDWSNRTLWILLMIINGCLAAYHLTGPVSVRQSTEIQGAWEFTPPTLPRWLQAAANGAVFYACLWHAQWFTDSYWNRMSFMDDPQLFAFVVLACFAVACLPFSSEHTQSNVCLKYLQLALTKLAPAAEVWVFALVAIDYLFVPGDIWDWEWGFVLTTVVCAIASLVHHFVQTKYLVPLTVQKLTQEANLYFIDQDKITRAGQFHAFGWVNTVKAYPPLNTLLYATYAFLGGGAIMFAAVHYANHSQKLIGMPDMGNATSSMNSVSSDVSGSASSSASSMSSSIGGEDDDSDALSLDTQIAWGMLYLIGGLRAWFWPYGAPSWWYTALARAAVTYAAAWNSEWVLSFLWKQKMFMDDPQSFALATFFCLLMGMTALRRRQPTNYSIVLSFAEYTVDCLTPWAVIWVPPVLLDYLGLCDTWDSEWWCAMTNAVGFLAALFQWCLRYGEAAADDPRPRAKRGEQAPNKHWGTRILESLLILFIVYAALDATTHRLALRTVPSVSDIASSSATASDMSSSNSAEPSDSVITAFSMNATSSGSSDDASDSASAGLDNDDDFTLDFATKICWAVACLLAMGLTFITQGASHDFFSNAAVTYVALRAVDWGFTLFQEGSAFMNDKQHFSLVLIACALAALTADAPVTWGDHATYLIFCDGRDWKTTVTKGASALAIGLQNLFTLGMFLVTPFAMGFLVDNILKPDWILDSKTAFYVLLGLSLGVPLLCMIIVCILQLWNKRRGAGPASGGLGAGAAGRRRRTAASRRTDRDYVRKLRDVQDSDDEDDDQQGADDSAALLRGEASSTTYGSSSTATTTAVGGPPPGGVAYGTGPPLGESGFWHPTAGGPREFYNPVGIDASVNSGYWVPTAAAAGAGPGGVAAYDEDDDGDSAATTTLLGGGSGGAASPMQPIGGSRGGGGGGTFASASAAAPPPAPESGGGFLSKLFGGDKKKNQAAPPAASPFTAMPRPGPAVPDEDVADLEVFQKEQAAANPNLEKFLPWTQEQVRRADDWKKEKGRRNAFLQRSDTSPADQEAETARQQRWHQKEEKFTEWWLKMNEALVDAFYDQQEATAAASSTTSTTTPTPPPRSEGKKKKKGGKQRGSQ